MHVLLCFFFQLVFNSLLCVFFSFSLEQALQEESHIIKVEDSHKGLLDFSVDTASGWMALACKDGNIKVPGGDGKQEILALFFNLSLLLFFLFLSLSLSFSRQQMWSLHELKLIKAWMGHSKSTNVVVVRGNLVISGSSDKLLKLWDASAE
jgi:hypothetical protein